MAHNAPLLPETSEAAIAARTPLDRFTPLDAIEQNMAAADFMEARREQGQAIPADAAIAEIHSREAMRMAEFMARTGRDPRLPQNQNPTRNEQRLLVDEAAQGRANEQESRMRRGFDPFIEPTQTVTKAVKKPKRKPRVGADPGDPPRRPQPLKPKPKRKPRVGADPGDPPRKPRNKPKPKRRPRVGQDPAGGPPIPIRKQGTGSGTVLPRDKILKSRPKTRLAKAKTKRKRA